MIYGGLTFIDLHTISTVNNDFLIVRCQANLAVQEARYEAAMKDLNKAQDQLDEKEKELEAVQAQYDQAMSEKQVGRCHTFN